jgi:hypothetical protein
MKLPTSLYLVGTSLVLRLGEGIVGNMEMETIEQLVHLLILDSTVGLCTLLRLNNTYMDMELLEQAWVFWLGELMQQV